MLTSGDMVTTFTASVFSSSDVLLSVMVLLSDTPSIIP